MKNIFIFLLSLMILTGICSNANAQSISVSGSLFLPQDSIGFTYSKPGSTSTDWIGIYKADQTPGQGSISWSYIKSDAGTVNLKAPAEAGKYKAYLLCCDGYDVVASTSEFSVEIPSLTTSYLSYVQGDSVVFSYKSPKLSATDKIAIYPEGTKPANGVVPTAWKYIPASTGSLTFKTALTTGYYDAYLLCCDGIDSISACSFEIIDQSVAFITPRAESFDAGEIIELSYNDAAFAAGDWIGIFKDGEPSTGTSITWSNVTSSSGTKSFPGNLAGGYYYAALLSSTNVEYAISVSFNVAEATEGSYVKTAASIYPEGTTIQVNYKDVGYSSKDWIGIYKKGQTPGGPEALVWNYAPNDSSTIEFGSLSVGDYEIFMLCCDGYTIKAKSAFKVVDQSSSYLISTLVAYIVGDPLEFTYNSVNFSSTDWLGIYKKGEISGGAGIYSTWWRYLPEGNGTMTFSYPDDYGENQTDTSLPVGEYWAGLFCCDAYDLFAQTSFAVVEEGTGISEFNLENRLSLFPNPTNGLVSIKIANTDKLQRIAVYNLTGQIIYQEKLSGVNQKTLDLKHLTKGVYFIEALTGKYKTSKKLIVR